ncbi:MAG: 23S rRNA (adenine(2503)-C(2))-methyltransferase RlmN, partial [Eubacteriales bacterium]|nr:23S rRNA (adenine(2503)-C(2))-methyltransferase RlmN [Eubacteriales bacterium]
MKTDLRNLTLDEMKAWVLSKDQPKFRGEQLFEWVSKGTRDFREMRNLPESFRNVLMDTSSLDSLTLLRSQQSKMDGTQKFLFAVEGGDAVETVFMRYRYGNSLCISSQAGCRMGCAFCASGMKGLSRNLTAGELFSQVIDAEKETGMTVSHIVLMGTGEPFDNYEEVSKFLRIIRDPAGRGMSSRNITVSTCGLIPCIQRFSEDFPEVNLAISLHAPNQEIRSRIMPVSKKYSFGKLLGACRRYTEATHRRVTFEYALIKDVNDRDR